MHWEEIPNAHGALQAVLLGDPATPGIYVIRVKFPPHIMDRPHWHSTARYVTVLEGTWVTGTGDTFDLARAVSLKPGSVMLHPAKGVHWDGSGGAEPVVVQIIGEGPVTTIRSMQPSRSGSRYRTSMNSGRCANPCRLQNCAALCSECAYSLRGVAQADM